MTGPELLEAFVGRTIVEVILPASPYSAPMLEFVLDTGRRFLLEYTLELVEGES